MTPEQRKIEEEQIKNSFSELQKKLLDLQNEIRNESDATKKQEKQAEFDKMKSELDDMKKLIDKLSLLQEQDLQSLKTRLEQYSQIRQQTQGEVADLQNEKSLTPTTYELLKDSMTIKGIEGDASHPGLLKIIELNPKNFEKVPGATPEAKLEYIFSKVRNNIILFMKNKLGNSENTEKVINNTIAPAFEWSLIEMLRDQGNETNIRMLTGIGGISFDSFNKLVSGVSNFAKKASGSYNKFSQWMNAVDYLSVHNGVLRNPNKSEVLSNPLKFKEYMNDARFADSRFSPYAVISDNIFKIDENQTFEFGMSLQEKQNVLDQLGNIQVKNNPKTTALIAKMLDKPEKFLGATAGLQQTANSLLDGINSLNSVTKNFGVDILGELSQTGEKSLAFRILDFVCKLIGITGGLEGIVKRWRLDRLNLTDEKNENISQIFGKYKEFAGDNVSLSITDENSCKTALNKFGVTNPQNTSSTKGDLLRDSMVRKMDLSLISPAVVQQTLGNDYLKKETIMENGRTKETIVVDESKITSSDKLKIAQNHLINMKDYLEKYNDNNLSDFYTNIHSTEDLALCIIASLYASKSDVVEGVKAKVFLPENYGSVAPVGMDDDTSGGVTNNPSGGTVDNGGGETLDSSETSDKQVVTEQWIYDKAVEYGVTDKRQIAYILSTVKGESGFKNQEEIGKGNGKEYGKVDSVTGYAYYGRGFLQLTWKENYKKYTQIIQSSGRIFKDNNGNLIKGSEIDLVKNPNIILQSNDLAVFILVDWMKNGGPDRLENKKLSYYINETKQDYYNARIIINGMTSSPKKYADSAQAYLGKLNNVGNITA